MAYFSLSRDERSACHGLTASSADAQDSDPTATSTYHHSLPLSLSPYSLILKCLPPSIFLHHYYIFRFNCIPFCGFRCFSPVHILIPSICISTFFCLHSTYCISCLSPLTSLVLPSPPRVCQPPPQLFLLFS